MTITSVNVIKVAPIQDDQLYRVSVVGNNEDEARAKCKELIWEYMGDMGGTVRFPPAVEVPVSVDDPMNTAGRPVEAKAWFTVRTQMKHSEWGVLTSLPDA